MFVLLLIFSSVTVSESESAKIQSLPGEDATSGMNFTVML